MLPKSPCLFSPLCGMLEGQLAKSVGNNVSQCQPPKRKGQSQDSVTTDCYSMGYTPGKLLTLTKSTRQRHHKSKGGNPCSHFRISWDYDTAVIKGRMTPLVKGSCNKYCTESQKGSLLLAINTYS